MNIRRTAWAAVRGILPGRTALAWIAAGAAVVLLTPFVFFPEILGDVGVTRASALRNGAALVTLALGIAATLAGLLSLVRLACRRSDSARQVRRTS